MVAQRLYRLGKPQYTFVLAHESGTLHHGEATACLLDVGTHIDLYLRTWRTLRESAMFGADARNRISCARGQLNGP